MNQTAPASGLDVRRKHFADTMEFYAPGLKRWQTGEWQPDNARRFLPVSVTGGACALQCDHCRAAVLKGMPSVPAAGGLFPLAQKLRAGGTDGVLVSGGSRRDGGVPLLRHVPDMRRVREELGMKVVVHSGLVDDATADGLAEAGVDAVMLDIIGADATVREVYHLDRTAADFDRSLALLAARGLRIIPHIVLGMHYGRFLGEHDALDMVRQYPVSTLILVVLMPLTGTPMAALPPPDTDEVIGFFRTARHAMPDTPINLGCGRPMGEVKVRLDRGAVDEGLNGIAYPADGAIAYAKSRGLEPKLYEYCCSMTWADDHTYQRVSLEDACDC